jgi:hypothetical protein
MGDISRALDSIDKLNTQATDDFSMTSVAHRGSEAELHTDGGSIHVRQDYGTRQVREVV